MTELIIILISLLGYGSPEDYSSYTEQQLVTEIEYQESQQDGEAAPGDDDGRGGDWDLPN